MFCRKCGQQLPEGSLFCNKCGCEVNEINNDEIISTNDPQNDLKSAESSSNIGVILQNTEIRRIKFKKPFIISAILVAVIFAIIGYNIHFNNCFNQAKSLYWEEQYYDAGKKLNGLININNDKTFKEIKYSADYGAFFQFYKSEVDSTYSNYDMAISNLFSGLSGCISREDIVKDDVEKEVLTKFKQKYYDELSNKFHLSLTEVTDIRALDYESQKSKFSEIAKNFKSKEDELINKRKNPIEFKNLDWDSNSLYTVAIGQVQNVSDATIKFVQIKVAFKDSSGNVIDTDSTYAVGSEGLAPGESAKWRASVNKDNNIHSYTVSLIDFN